MNDKRVANIQRLYVLQTLCSFVAAGFVGILYLHFFKQHISLVDFFLAQALADGAVTSMIAVRRIFFSRRDIQVGFLIVGIALALLLMPFSRSFFYVYTVVRMVGTILFFTPYNILFFEETHTDRRLRSMTGYWAVSVVVGVVAPVACGFIFEQFGRAIFIGSALVLIIAGIVVGSRVPSRVYRYTTKEVYIRLKKLRTINMLDGALHRVEGAVGFFALLYFTNELNYGIYLSLMALVALVPSFYIAHVSDTRRERMRFMWPISLATGALVWIFAGIHSLSAFIIAMMALNAITVLIEPLRSTILLDATESAPVDWIARELFLNTGRMFFSLTVALFLWFNLTTTLFIFLGILHMAFPCVVWYKKIYKRHSA